MRLYGTGAAQTLMGAYAWNDEMMKIMMQLYREAAVMFGNEIKTYS